MISENRKQQMLDLIRKNGSVRVANLSQLFEVSEVTVRNYLAEMEKQGLLSRTHGGAISSYKPYYSMNLNQRLETNQTAKVAILIDTGQTNWPVPVFAIAGLLLFSLGWAMLNLGKKEEI